MINVIFGGGLGNQMFQYAFIFAQLKQQGMKDVKIRGIMHRNQNEDFRSFSLDTLNCSLEIDVVDEQQVGKGYLAYSFGRKIILKVTKILGYKDEEIVDLMSRFRITYTPQIYGYYPNLRINRNNCMVEGSFQAWKYFDEYRSDIQNELTVTREASKENLSFLHEIESCQSVCIHVRRGDYINSHYAKTLAICDYNYYKNAMDFIASKVSNPVFYIFSNSHDDHKWIKKHYRFGYDVHYVDLNNPDYEELRLMYSCKHFIISNSTFSWWAQYLSRNPEKIVVAPSKWYNGNIDTNGIYMPNWNLIDVKEKKNEF